MKGIPWSLVVVIVAMLGSLSFLVYERRLDSTLLVSLVSAITGGGLLHLGGASAFQASAPAPPQPSPAPPVASGAVE